MRKYTDEQFIEAVKSSLTINETLTKLGVAPSGGNYFTFHNHVKRLNLDTSHFNQHYWIKDFDWGKEPKPPIEAILVNPGIVSNSEVKKRLFAENIKKHQCEYCMLTEWMGKPIPLELEHVSGDNKDNRLENLKMICPNCHALTPTYRGRNIRVKREKLEKDPNYQPPIKAENKAKKTQKARKRSSKTPNRQALLDLLIKVSWDFDEAGEILQVSHNSVRRWCIKLDLPSNQKSLRDFRINRPSDIGEDQSISPFEGINHNSKIPSRELLLEALLEVDFNFVKAGVKLGVSDNGLRKWCKKYGVPANRKEILDFQNNPDIEELSKDVIKSLKEKFTANNFELECEHCENIFSSDRKTRRFCSQKCSQESRKL